MKLPIRFASPVSGVATLSLALLLSACATSSKVDAEWTDPALRGQMTSLRGTSVMVACEAPDLAVRNVCQDQLAAEVTARGARPIAVPPGTPLVRDQALDQQLVPAARAAGARAIVVVALTPVATEDDRPSISLGLGGFGFGGRSGVGGGLGVSAPVGEGRVATGFSANGRITEAGTGRLLWTATRAAPPSQDLDRQLGSLSVAVLDSAARAGLF